MYICETCHKQNCPIKSEINIVKVVDVVQGMFLPGFVVHAGHLDNRKHQRIRNEDLEKKIIIPPLSS